MTTHPEKRAIHAPEALRRMLNPCSVALVGASENPASFASRTLQNLAGYTGEIYLVNSKYETLGGQPCYKDLASLPQSPDCVIAAIPRAGIEPVLQEAIAARAGGVIVYASGYSETGIAQRTAEQQRIANLVRPTGTRILGPNCLGAITAGTNFSATFAHTPSRIQCRDGKGIGLVSQSGALGVALIQAVNRGVSFSHMLTSGNSCDVDVCDLIGFLAADPSCGVIACVFEGTDAPRRLLEAGELARRHRKPVVICKIAGGEEGAAAAMSHTGSMAGSAAGYDALFEMAGFIKVDDFEALVEIAGFLAKAPPWKAAGVAVISPSGGAAILCADAAEKEGVQLPQPSDATTIELKEVIPEFGSARNPCDVTAQVLTDPGSLDKCIKLFCAEPGIGAVVMPHMTAYDVGTQRTLSVSPTVAAAGVPLCVVWMTEWLEGPGAEEIEQRPDIALFRSARRCFAALHSWSEWASRLQRREESIPARHQVSIPEQRTVINLLGPLQHRRALTEREAKQVLQAFGVRAASDEVASSAAEAVAAANRTGYPVVLKVESEDIPHKTDAGAVKLNLKSDAEVAAAFDEVMGNAKKAVPAAVILGVLVQPMVASGLEMLVGGRIDPLFGPMVVVGFGGVLVELLDDSVAALAPVTPAKARTMLQRLRGAALLDGFRGSAPVDLDVLANTVSRISLLISDHAGSISEIDVNPLICSGSSVIAVDALIVGRVLPTQPN